MTKKTPGIWIACAALILGAIVLAAVGHFHSAPYTIVVDGKPIVTVESRSTAKKVLADVRLQGTTIVSPSATQFVQSVTFRRAEKNPGLSDLPEAVRALEKAVTIEAEGFAIIVNDEPVVALPRKSDADSTLELVKRFYERKIKTLYTSSTFKENVFVDKRYVEAERLRATPADAVSALTTTSERPLTHVVQRGDRAVNIIRQYKISLADLKALNQGINPDKLTEGDILTVRLPKLPITVVCKSLITETVKVTPPVDVRSGPRTGTRTSKILVTSENGRRAGQEIISQVTTWDRPAPRKYSRSRSKPVKSVSTPKPAENGSGQNTGKPPE
ncbi:MAG TPA: LysM domain-containing protein [Armatimonadota bacterium]|nr:LysM domain-containing protein [Armatimonadota bacterium]